MAAEPRIELADIQQLQAESGQEARMLRLRAIVAERRVRELEARVAELETQVTFTQQVTETWGRVTEV